MLEQTQTLGLKAPFYSACYDFVLRPVARDQRATARTAGDAMKA